MLFALRWLDDNALTSWRWVFGHINPARVFLLLAAATGLCLALLRFRLDKKYEQTALFVLSWLAIVPLWQEPEVIIDASRYFMEAKYLSETGVAGLLRDWGRGLKVWTDLPLIPSIFGLLFLIFGEQREVIQTFTTLQLSFGVLLTQRIGAMLWDRETGFLAGLLLLASPYLLIQAGLMLVDIHCLFAVTFALYAYLRALVRGGITQTVLAGAAIAGACLTKYSAWPMLLVLPLATAAAYTRGNAAAVRRSVGVFVTAIIIISPIIITYYDVIQSQIKLLSSYQWPGLARWGEGHASTFLFQIHPFVSLFAVLGVFRAIRERDIRFLVPAWFAFFVIGLRVERIRYMLPLFPLFCLMAGYGLRGALVSQRARLFAASCAAAAAIVLAHAAYVPFLNKTTAANLKNAGAYLDTLPGDDVSVRVMPQSASTGNTEAAVPILDIFTRKRIVIEGAPLRRPDDDVARRSSLLFTWEQQVPAFYAGYADRMRRPLVIISDTPHPEQDENPKRIFSLDTGSFRYRTAVTVIP